MGEEPGTSGAAVGGNADPEEIQAQIESTRRELGDTVEALAEKTDVKAQAQRKIEETKATLSEKKDELRGKAEQASPEAAVSAASQASRRARENPLPVAAVGAFAAGFLVGRLTSR
jgi:ElaB/YqjD/DUF883 family membrane-anchored ribosome-binding protein